MPMTDPIALAVVFPGNLETKITNIHWRYSGYLISSKYEFQNPSPAFYQQSFFRIIQKLIFLNEGQNTDDGS